MLEPMLEDGMTSPILRLACPDDAPAIAKLARDTFCETFVQGFAVGYPAADLARFLDDSYALEKVAAWIADPLAQVLVSEQCDRLIAYAHAGENDLPYDGARPGDGELKRIYVSNAAQGAGVGRDLLERSLDWLGARPIYIGVWSGNLKAQRLYGHYGFKPVGGYKFAVGETLDDEVILGRP
jgi:ribosomal protein S18 acetylase RimI-like enzyme